MEIHCPGCDCAFSFEGQPPRFCQNCGTALSGISTATPQPVIPISIDADVTIAPSAPVIKPAAPLGAGEIVGPYQLVRWLGSGGMGNVWEAIETQTGRRVALKRLAKSMVADETYVKRFVREAQLAAKISHPKVTFIYGAGEHEGQPYIAMELMPGKTLADKVDEEGPLDYPIAVDGIIDAVDGLIAAHKLGMIHRDVKPSNCFLDTDESVKIGDFGLSKSLEATEVNLTQTGTFMGTPSYAAPEQIRGGELDGRTDIYSLGATLFFLLTGKTPFRGDAMSVTAQIISDKPPSCCSLVSKIPVDLGNVISKCIEKEPSKRFQDLEQLRLALIPFATQQESIADVGRRLAAYMIDQTMLQILITAGMVVWSVSASITMQIGQELSQSEVAQAMQNKGTKLIFWGSIIMWGLTFLYYAICEGRFGRGVGKRLMGLKVVNKEGQRVGFWRALLRACIVPGAVGIPLMAALWQSFYGSLPVTVDEHVLHFLRSISLSYLPSLIFVSTMRTSNRLLGIHGMLSGTRVIRFDTRDQKTNVPVVEPKPTKLTVMKFGPYEADQLMGESQTGKVYWGIDQRLNRDVWVVVGSGKNEPGGKRINLARVARQRWLEGGTTDDGQRWDAFESIHGVPIQSFVGIQSTADWTQYGRVMIDIVDEVTVAIEDGTLPSTVALPQVWLDRDGHAKLLDRQLVNAVCLDSNQDSLSDVSESSEIEKAVRLVQELGDLFDRTQVLPASVQDFILELKTRPQTKATLAWAKEQLSAMSKKTTSLSWDSRLGVLSATMGVEFIVYMLTASCLILFCYYVAPIPNSYRFLVGLAAGLLLPIGLNAWFCGGPVFRMMGIQVCKRNGRPAHWVLVAVRAALTWLPIIALLSVFLIVLIFSEEQTTNVAPEPGTLAADVHTNAIIQWTIAVSVLFSFVAIPAGLLITVLSPKRGLVDWLIGTQLMPK